MLPRADASIRPYGHPGERFPLKGVFAASHYYSKPHFPAIVNLFL